jgi:hypothetical protein
MCRHVFSFFGMCFRFRHVFFVLRLAQDFVTSHSFALCIYFDTVLYVFSGVQVGHFC